MPTLFPIDRYEAAIRLERARQVVRESTRYNFPVTSRHLAEVRAAEEIYEAATAALVGT
jgi:hypothetical protein